VGDVKHRPAPLVFPSGLRAGQFMVVNGRVRPIVAGGADGDPPPAPPAPPAPGQAPDLDALQAALDGASRSAGSKATGELLTALGFSDLDAAQAFVKAARDREDAEKTELQKAQDALARAELAATQARTEAAAAQRARLIERALVAKGANPAHVERLTRLVDVPADADEAAVNAEVDKLAAEFSAVFSAAGAPPAPSGHTGGKPPASSSGGKTAYERGQERWAQQHPSEKAS
jgi:hypothetical protein